VILPGPRRDPGPEKCSAEHSALRAFALLARELHPPIHSVRNVRRPSLSLSLTPGCSQLCLLAIPSLPCGETRSSPSGPGLSPEQPRRPHLGHKLEPSKNSPRDLARHRRVRCGWVGELAREARADRLWLEPGGSGGDRGRRPPPFRPGNLSCFCQVLGGGGDSDRPSVTQSNSPLGLAGSFFVFFGQITPSS
jgi:hypothetical protein